MSCEHFRQINAADVIERVSNQGIISEIANRCFFCNECSQGMGKVWLCLAANCTYKGCGRFQNRHSTQHFMTKRHPVFINPANLSIYCMTCEHEISETAENSQSVSLIRSVFRQHMLQPELGNGFKWKGLTGLNNLGNTCYMNSALQALSNTRSVQRFFLKAFDKSYLINKPDQLLVEKFADLIKEIWRGNLKTKAPREFVMALQKTCPFFEGKAQHDSQELLKILLDKLHESLKHGKGSIISDSFRSKMKVIITCLECGTSSENVEDHFEMILSIPSPQEKEKYAHYQHVVPLNDRVKYISEKQNIWQKIRGLFEADDNSVTLYDCLLNFCLAEELSTSNMFDCPTCDRKRRVSRECKIIRPPNVLVFFVKRIKYAGAKVRTYVKFPRELDLKFFLDKPEDCKYSLYGVVEHLGGIGSGHYISYFKHQKTGLWHEFDDSRVREVSEETVTSKEACILLYEKNFEQRQKLTYAEPSAFIPTYWVNKYYTLARPGTIRQAHLLCKHNQMSSLYKLSEFAQISRKLLDGLVSEFTTDSSPVEQISACPRCPLDFQELEVRISQELTIIKELMAIQDFEGPWFIVSTHWIKKWKAFMEHNSDCVPYPGPIDNSALLDSEEPVKGQDYRGVSRHVWRAIHLLYGGGPELPRMSLNIHDAPPPPLQYSTPDLDEVTLSILENIKNSSKYLSL